MILAFVEHKYVHLLIFVNEFTHNTTITFIECSHCATFHMQSLLLLLFEGESEMLSLGTTTTSGEPRYG